MTAAIHPPRPRKQSKLLAILTPFAGHIEANPARYKGTPEEAHEIRTAVDAFAESLEITCDPGKKTRVTVNAKDGKRRIAEEIHSKFYNLIKADPAISDCDKIAIGVLPVNPERTPIAAPGSVPLLNVISATPHAHTLRFRNPGTLTEDGSFTGCKPRGAAFIQVYAAIGAPGSGSGDCKVSGAREVGLYTRNPIVVEHESQDNGRQAVYWARWISPRGEAGNWSLPTSMAIAA